MKAILLSLLLLWTASAGAQITFVTTDGGPVQTRLGMGMKLNKASTLHREWVILNDEGCPLKLDRGTGLNTEADLLRFVTTGTLNPDKPVAALEIHFVLYDMFGTHIRTLSFLDVMDLNGTTSLAGRGIWAASKVEAEIYFRCVTFVAAVRTMDGEVWKYTPGEIRTALEAMNIVYDESFLPTDYDE
ncbi:MAG: hypothetical protein R2751_13745 [Bacteroidales bacterium]